MRLDRALRDGEAEAKALRAAGVAAPAVERLEDPAELLRRDAGAAVGHADHGARRIHLQAHGDVDGGSRRGVLHRVAHDVLHRAVQELGAAAHDGAADPMKRDVAPGGLRLEARVLRHARHDVGELDGLSGGIHALQPRQRQDFAHQLGKPRGFALDALERGVELLRALAHQADRRLQARERRAQLVRHVVQQPPLRGDQLLQLLRHAVEVAPEIGDLVAPASHQRAHARLEAPARRGVERPAQAADRPRQVPGEDRAHGEAGGGADHDQHPRRHRQRRRGRRKGGMRNEQQIALAARRGDDLRGARVPGFGGQLPRPRQGAFRHRPAEEIVAGRIDGEDAHPSYSARLLHPFAQGGDAAVPERGGRHVGGEHLRRPHRELRLGRLSRVAVPPYRGAAAGRRRHQREPEREEDFPEQAPHAAQPFAR